MKHGNRTEVGPVSSYELRGRPATDGGDTPELGDDFNAATALRKLRAAIERTLTRAEADATSAMTLHEVNILVRRALRQLEHESDGW